MQYDPIKKSLGNVFNRSPFLRKIFYKLLDLLLLRTWHVRKELRQFKKTSGNATHILDAGSGFGQYVYFMSGLEKRWQILGVDVKNEQVTDCNSFFEKIGRAERVKFETADLTKYRAEKQYDFILSVDVMEHILEDVDVFRNMHASLKDGGMLLVSTPSDQGGSDVHDHDHDSSFVDEHVRDGYNVAEIQDKLKTAGFSKIEALYSYGTPGQISWRLSMKYPIKMLNASKLFFVILPFYYLLLFPLCLILNKIDVIKTHKKGTGLIVRAWK